MPNKIVLFLVTLVVFLIIDLVWLGFIARHFYRNQLGFLMSENTNWGAAVVFYLIYILGLVVFVITPALEKTSWVHAVVYGGLFGLVAYATYDLTNLATIKNWPLTVTIVDTIWGTVLTAATCTASYFISSLIG